MVLVHHFRIGCIRMHKLFCCQKGLWNCLSTLLASHREHTGRCILNLQRRYLRFVWHFHKTAWFMVWCSGIKDCTSIWNLAQNFRLPVLRKTYTLEPPLGGGYALCYRGNMYVGRTGLRICLYRSSVKAGYAIRSGQDGYGLSIRARPKYSTRNHRSKSASYAS